MFFGPCSSNKGFSSRLCVDCRHRHETPEEGRRTYRSKRCEYNIKDKINSPNILSNNNTKIVYIIYTFQTIVIVLVVIFTPFRT